MYQVVGCDTDGIGIHVPRIVNGDDMCVPLGMGLACVVVRPAGPGPGQGPGRDCARDRGRNRNRGRDRGRIRDWGMGRNVYFIRMVWRLVSTVRNTCVRVHARNGVANAMTHVAFVSVTMRERRLHSNSNAAIAPVARVLW